MFSTKSVKKLMKFATPTNLLMVVALVVLVLGIRQFSLRKFSVSDAMSGLSPGTFVPEEDVEKKSHPEGAMSSNNEYATVDQLSNIESSESSNATTNPDDLLPKDENNEWAKLNPTGTGDLNNVNLLKAGYHCGVDTVSNSLRNANLQIRSEPPNPTDSVSPWLNSTIEPDTNRVTLELGSCGH
tara:strand:- start:1309 stop:1860 length:552 start_codon:yes stop_codon:yes gene_type:complete